VTGPETDRAGTHRGWGRRELGWVLYGAVCGAVAVTPRLLLPAHDDIAYVVYLAGLLVAFPMSVVAVIAGMYLLFLAALTHVPLGGRLGQSVFDALADALYVATYVSQSLVVRGIVRSVRSRRAGGARDP
jgi:hypothetical protein